MTNELNNQMTSNYRSADVFGGPYGMQTPAGMTRNQSFLFEFQAYLI